MIDKKQNEIEKPSVVFDNGLNRSESPRTNRGRVTNLDPDYHYVEIRKDDQDEIQRFADMGYEPARGKEGYESSAFSGLLGNDKPTEGGLKIRGNRILVRIKKDVYDKRNISKLKARHNPAKQAGDRDARDMIASNRGSVVKSIGENE